MGFSFSKDLQPYAGFVSVLCCALIACKGEQAINSELPFVRRVNVYREEAVDLLSAFADTNSWGEKDEGVGCACWPGRVG